MRLGIYKGLCIDQPDFSVSESRIDRFFQKKQNEHAVILHGDDGKNTVLYQPLDDDFARDFSDFDTMAQWRQSVRDEWEARREASVTERINRELLSQIIADSDIPIDRSLQQEVYEMLYEDFLYDLDDDGTTFEQYCKRTGKTKRQIKSEKKEEAIRVIQTESVLHAIAQAEHLTVSDEMLYAELAAIATEEGEDPDTFAAMLDEDECESIRDQLLMDLSMQLIWANVTIRKEK